jgi:predicted DNA repair protein MutK
MDMASGLVALLDDIAGITKLAAASLDDIGAAAGKAGTKAVGVVVDDAAVTPNYVVGFSPDRELPIIARIAKGSLRNKLIFILPAALALSAFAPWALNPLLMVGGAYLCFEGAEKLLEAFGGGHDDAGGAEQTLDTKALEEQKVGGAIRTDFILSAEIMVIALAEVADATILNQAIVLAVVGVLITIGVYGAVALIVKMDDIGLYLSRKPSSGVATFGRGLVKGMPILMRVLGIVGTAAMLWVGGGILLHGLEAFGVAGPAHVVHDWSVAAGAALPAVGGVLAWAVSAAAAGVIGVVVGAIIVAVVHRFKH